MEAVEDKVGGSNSALAQTIATEHPGTPGNLLVWYIKPFELVNFSVACTFGLVSFLVLCHYIQFSNQQTQYCKRPINAPSLEMKLLEGVKAWEQGYTSILVYNIQY